MLAGLYFITCVFAMQPALFAQNTIVKNASETSLPVYITGQNTSFLSWTTSIEEHSFAVSSIFPNPSADKIIVSLSQRVRGTLTMYDINGREVYKENINGDNITIDVSRMPVGFYNLFIVSGTKKQQKKIIIVR